MNNVSDEQYEFVCSDCGTNVQADAKVCPKCGANLEEATESAIESKPPEPLTPEWAKDIESKLASLEARFPKSDIISHSFWRRAWTVVGYSIAVEIVILLGFFLVALLVKGCIG
ncbi:MAG: zinc ribbon domain-containing protein [Ignavibacteria bacterium]|nr:zinc ribbon domain-containing protein [Ignavibacteria bacterium]